eukprot:CAMPEP_0116567264 /NCGR_PEP_ID=MMETSP0397-20121206/14906_1 /TAXON_ID=216820 /ORGANISM="Cyclophora tenuis, Strain ECT3854" /LENGTH=284 /DNA_ID=CAMNT_0004094227 /DNA_START=336 /DNA_END=1190 /DNA_ORIENTATION=+
MTTPRWGCCCVTFDSHILVMGGYSSDPYNQDGKGIFLASAEMLILQQDLPEPPALIPFPIDSSKINLTRQERIVALQDWMTQIQLRKAVYENQVGVAQNREENYCAHQTRIADEEIAKLKNKIAFYESERLIYRENKDSRIAMMESMAKPWFDAVQQQLEDAQDQVDSLTARLDRKLSSSSLQSRSSSNVVAQQQQRQQQKHRRRKKLAEECPDDLMCPITLELMVDPVIALDGHTYERSAIERVFAATPRGHMPRSPVTGANLPSYNLIPNVAIRRQCREYQN